MSSCLFCAVGCPPKFTFVGGQVKKLKTENGSSSSSFSFSGGGDSAIVEQLKVVFILRKILGIGEEKLCEFLGSCGQLHPEYWVSVCLSCQETVNNFYETVREIGRLERKLMKCSDELKGHIYQTKDEEGKGHTGMLWGAIRSEVLIEMEKTNDDADHFEDECNTDQKQVATQHPEGSITIPVLSLKQDHEFGSREPNSDPEWEPHSETGDIQPTSDDEDDYDPPAPAKNPSKTKIRFAKTQNPKWTEFYRGSTKHLGCRQCPATNTYPSLMEAHLKLHEEGSGAIPCQICGWILKPESLTYHYGKRHPLPGGQRRSGKIYEEKTYHFQCPKCKALLTDIGKYRSHEELHRKGEGEVCPKCKWLCKSIARHKGYWHNPRTKIPKREIRLMDKAGWEKVKKRSKTVNRGVKNPLPNLKREWVNAEEKDDESNFSEHRFSLFLDSDDDIPAVGPEPGFLKSSDLESLMKTRNTFWKKPIRNVDDSHPRYTRYYRGNTKYYGCRLCAAEDSYPTLLKEHMKLHKNDSGAVPCSICGWKLMPNRLTYHFGKHHKTPEEKQKEKISQELFYYQCPDCSALLCSIGKYREHAQMHENGKGVLCEKKSCGWLVKGLARHVTRWHPTTGKGRKIKHTRQIKLIQKESHAS